jgi:hypothetical protein
MPTLATNANCIGYGLTGHGIDRMIYRIRGEHANHHTTDAVLYFIA